MRPTSVLITIHFFRRAQRVKKRHLYARHFLGNDEKLGKPFDIEQTQNREKSVADVSTWAPCRLCVSAVVVEHLDFGALTGIV